MIESFNYWLPTVAMIAGPFILASVLMVSTRPLK